ncbi:tetratricopeptide repeat protein [Luteolibacter sp. Populi]|uniref:tetratricopeptide repeat protein n=1 Tax=Luteolibacter sp. Populi TaxID=3230487 RepID=UPI0034662D2A
MSKLPSPIIAVSAAVAGLSGKCLSLVGDLKDTELLDLITNGDALGLAAGLTGIGVLAADYHGKWKDGKKMEGFSRTLQAIFRNTEEVRRRIPYAGVLIDECEQGLTNPNQVQLSLDDPAYPAFALYKALKRHDRPAEDCLREILSVLTKQDSTARLTAARQKQFAAELAEGQLTVLRSNHQALIALIEAKDLTARSNLDIHLASLRLELVAALDEIRSGIQTLLAGQQAHTSDLSEIKDSVRVLIERPSFRPHPIPHQLPPAADRFFGRVVEHGKLTARLREGKHTAVLGPAGMGKTALAAEVLASLFGKATPTDLARTLFPHGLVFLDLYSLKAVPDPFWHALANALQGDDFQKDAPAHERATLAAANKRFLLTIEGAEEADGTADRSYLCDLLAILPESATTLLLTRNSTQAPPARRIAIEHRLEPPDDTDLFRHHFGAEPPATLLAEMLALLEGHPLAITWAASLFGIEGHAAAALAVEWQGEMLPPIHDPDPNEPKHHTLQWLFRRSLRGLNTSTRRVLDAASLLARAPFPASLLSPILEGSATLRELAHRSILRSLPGGEWEFTHVLGYQFARQEVTPDAAETLAETLARQLAGELQEGARDAQGIDAVIPFARHLTHAAVLLETSRPPILWLSLANLLLYDIRDLLLFRGQLTHIDTCLRAVDDWLSRAPQDDPKWQRERSSCYDRFGDVALARGKLQVAAERFAYSLVVAETLAAANPNNTQWQRDLSICYHKLGGVAVAQGKLDVAAKRFADSLAVAETLAAVDPANTEWQRDLSINHDRLGDVAIAQGKLDVAANRFADSLAIREKLAVVDPANTEWLRDLSLSHDRLGDVAVAQGKLEVAANRFADSLAIREKLAVVDPANTLWQRDLSVSHERLGDVAVTQGKLEVAAKHFADSLAVAETLAVVDPANTEWQRDLSISHDRLGNVAVTQGKQDLAAKRFADSLAIREELAAADPDNTQWQRDLSMGYNKLGDVAIAQGDLNVAAERFADSLAVRETLAAAEPANTQWQGDLSISYNKLGDIALAQGKLEVAAKLFTDSLAIGEKLAAADPGNTEWQRDLASIHDRLGNVAVAQGRLDVAAKRFADSLAVADPDNAQWQSDLSSCYNKLGDVAVAQGKLDLADESFADSLAIREKLAAADPANTEWQRDLSVTHDRRGNLAFAQGGIDVATKRFADSLAIREKLAAANPANTQWQRDLFVPYYKLARLAGAQGDAFSERRYRQSAYDTLENLDRNGVHLAPEFRAILTMLKEKLADQ